MAKANEVAEAIPKALERGRRHSADVPVSMGPFRIDVILGTGGRVASPPPPFAAPGTGFNRRWAVRPSLKRPDHRRATKSMASNILDELSPGPPWDALEQVVTPAQVAMERGISVESPGGFAVADATKGQLEIHTGPQWDRSPRDPSPDAPGPGPQEAPASPSFNDGTAGDPGMVNQVTAPVSRPLDRLRLREGRFNGASRSEAAQGSTVARKAVGRGPGQDSGRDEWTGHEGAEGTLRRAGGRGFEVVRCPCSAVSPMRRVFSPLNRWVLRGGTSGDLDTALEVQGHHPRIPRSWAGGEEGPPVKGAWETVRCPGRSLEGACGECRCAPPKIEKPPVAPLALVGDESTEADGAEMAKPAFRIGPVPELKEKILFTLFHPVASTGSGRTSTVPASTP